LRRTVANPLQGFACRQAATGNSPRLQPIERHPTLPSIKLVPASFRGVIMRFLFLLLLFANIAVLAFGQGFMGTPPSEEGRTPRQLSERNQHVIQFGEPRLVQPAPSR